jgi:outer membrane murein-binding lipoprotein Lpp
MTINRHGIFCTLALVAGMTVFSGCSNSEKPQGAPASATNADANAKPDQGQKMLDATNTPTEKK